MRSVAVDRLEGEARHLKGDWEGALTCFGRVARSDGPLAPGIAWRMGLIHHVAGDLDVALSLYSRGVDGEGLTADHALVRAWAAAAHWLRSDLPETRRFAEEAWALSRLTSDDRALAACHTALALVAAMEGDRRANDAHYIRALRHAERAGDVQQVIRIRANRGSRLSEEGRYEEALAELDAAITLGELNGFGSFWALSLTNRGQVLAQLGRLDEAMRELLVARDEYQRLESRLVSYPLAHMGYVHLARGETALARAAYEEALEVAEGPGNVQGLSQALAGLARALVDRDPDQARRRSTWAEALVRDG